jgi:hypothetical protein
MGQKCMMTSGKPAPAYLSLSELFESDTRRSQVPGIPQDLITPFMLMLAPVLALQHGAQHICCVRQHQMERVEGLWKEGGLIDGSVCIKVRKLP